VLIQVDPEWT